MKKGHGAKYPRKRDEAILNLLSHPTVEAAAEATGVGRTTLLRWLKEQDFQDDYEKARRKIVQQATAQLRGIMGLAIKTLQDVMLDSEAPSSAKVCAAKAVIDGALRATELEDLDGRLQSLEESLNRF
jgi:hypothetical protein